MPLLFPGTNDSGSAYSIFMVCASHTTKRPAPPRLSPFWVIRYILSLAMYMSCTTLPISRPSLAFSNMFSCMVMSLSNHRSVPFSLVMLPSITINVPSGAAYPQSFSNSTSTPSSITFMSLSMAMNDTKPDCAPPVSGAVTVAMLSARSIEAFQPSGVLTASAYFMLRTSSCNSTVFPAATVMSALLTNSNRAFVLGTTTVSPFERLNITKSSFDVSMSSNNESPVPPAGTALPAASVMRLGPSP